MANLVPTPDRINNNDKGWSVRTLLNGFLKIFADAINKLYNESATKEELERAKLRYYETEAALKADQPSPSIGDRALVGLPYPGTVWGCKTKGVWYNTGVAPTPEEMNLAEYAKKDEVIPQIQSVFSAPNLFTGLPETNKFLAGNGGISSSDTYTGYLSDFTAVAPGEKIFYTIDFPYETVPAWGCIWGYADKKGTSPIKLVTSGTHIDQKLIIPENGSVKYIRFCHKKGDIPPKMTGTASVAQVTKMLLTDPHVKEVINGVNAIYGDVSNFKGSPIIERNIEEDYLVYKVVGTGNIWITSPIFIPENADLVHIRFKVELAKFNTTTGIRIMIADGINVSGKFKDLKDINEDGEYDITINPKELGYSQFCFWINNQKMPNGDSSITAKLSNLRVEANTNAVEAKNISGSNAKELFESADGQITALHSKKTSVIEVGNGSEVMYGDVSNFSGASIKERNIEEDYLVYRMAGTGNAWITSPIFIPSGKGLVYMRFKAELTKVNTTTGIRIHIANGTGTGGKFIEIKDITVDGEYEITIDPAYYTVYEGFTQFCFWINNQTMSNANSVIEAKISNLRVFEYDNSVQTTNISGSNAKELFESTDKAISDIKSSQSGSSDIKITPSGSKFELSIQDNGSVISIPIVPKKAVFFGNSLIAGYDYGMAASAVDKDYYYLITEYIKKLNPTFASSRLRAGGFEGLVDEAKIDSVIANDVIAQLSGDEDLVSIQLGDNVNTPEKNAVFPKSSLRLLQEIRKKCPRARVVWMGMWYPSAQRYQNIQDACSATGSIFISYADILTKPNVRSKVGYLTKRGLANRTLADVTKVVDNSAKNITVTFTLGSVSYESQALDIESYTLNAGVLSYRSEYQIISHVGEASHPGDDGFRWISNDFLYKLSITTNPEEYKS